jgi:hypothetical protein
MKKETVCKGIAGWLFGHKYEARYSFGKPTVDPTKSDSFWGNLVFSSDIAGIVSASKPRTYHGDVCVRCGDVINKQ